MYAVMTRSQDIESFFPDTISTVRIRSLPEQRLLAFEQVITAPEAKVGFCGTISPTEPSHAGAQPEARNWQGSFLGLLADSAAACGLQHVSKVPERIQLSH